MDRIRGSDNSRMHPSGILCESQHLAREGAIGSVCENSGSNNRFTWHLKTSMTYILSTYGGRRMGIGRYSKPNISACGTISMDS